MINKILLIIVLFSTSIFAQDKSACVDSLSEMFAQYDGDRSKIDEFLKIQAGITMHKLAYATFRNSGSKAEYTLEKEILNMLNQVQEKYQDDEEFREVYDMYHHPDNRLSRTALARVLPYIKDIINEQNSEQSAFQRKYFNIGLSDVRLLAILAEKESLRSNGVYDHRLFRNHSHDNSILNFAKVINSSVKNTNWDQANMLKNFEYRIKQLQQQAIALLEDMDLPPECLEFYGSCKSSEGDSELIDEEFLNLIGEALEKTDIDVSLSLRYDDVWLHTKTMLHGTRRGNARNDYQTDNPERAPTYVPEEEVIIDTSQSDEELVHEYLVNHIMGQVPYLFSRDELEANPEFTVALAQAVDDGILAKLGDNRKFIYNGKEYILPELWNGEHSDLGLGRIGEGVSSTVSWIFRLDSFDEDNTTIPSDIPTNLHSDFYETMNSQYKTFGRKYGFEFNGKLYTYPDAKPMVKGIDNFLSKYEQGDTDEVISHNPLKSENIADIAQEIRDGNRSYISGEDVFHISGAKVDLSREYDRMENHYSKTNTVVNEDAVDMEFPSEEDIEKVHKFYPQLTLKALTDRKRAFKGNDEYIDIFRKAPIHNGDAQSIVLTQRSLGQGNVSRDEIRSLPEELVKENAVAILNNELTFKYEGENYFTSTGKKVFSTPDGDGNSSSFEGKVDHEILHDRLVDMNMLDDDELVLEYYARHLDSKCDYVSVVDKEDATLSVYKFDGVNKIQVFQSQVGLGSRPGDQRTRYVNASLTATNNRSGAGEYTFGSFSSDRISLEHPNQSGPSKVVAMGVSKSEKTETELLLEPRNTYGNIEIPEPGKTYYQTNYVSQGCPFIVLPETNQLKYKVIEDDLRLITSNQFDHTQKTRDFHLSQVEEVESKDIEIVVNDPRFVSEKTTTFLEALEDEKAQIMQDLNLTNDEYNELVKLSFGIMGTESDFGEGSSNLFGLWNTYKIKETGLGQLTISMLKGELDLIPIYPGTVLPIQTNPDNNSRGNTQIKNVRDFLKDSYPDINRNNLDDPRNSAIATMYALKAKMDALKRVEGQHSAITEENRMDYLYYMYLGSTNQITGGSATPELNPKVKKANEFGDMLKIYTEP
jgi:hypothetical protein